MTTNKIFELDNQGAPQASAELRAQAGEDAVRFLPSARTDESMRYVLSVAADQARKAYTISQLVAWLGGIDKVAELAREKRNWVMRDLARGLGATLSWSSLDFKEEEKSSSLPLLPPTDRREP